jgi:nucleotide-binding universal stress UspA family protein
MNDAAALVLIGYDGSDPARRAVAAAGELLAPRRALVVSVWDAGMEYHFLSTGTSGVGSVAPELDIAATRKVDDARRARADRIAEDGAELARSVGLEAEPLAIAADGNAAKTIVELAGERAASAIVVGSRGLGAIRARLEGSTSNEVLKRAPCPVLVVHDD